jgi:hypothetical protein
MITTTFQISQSELDDLRAKCSEMDVSMADVIRVVVNDALQVDNAVLHRRVVDYYKRQTRQRKLSETKVIEHRFFCENEECRKRSNVTLNDPSVVETVGNQDGAKQEYVVTCPHCGVRQAVAL